MSIVDSIISKIFYRFVFKSFGNKSRIINPLKIDGARNIYIGDNVLIQYKTWLGALPLTGDNSCNLKIGNGSIIGNFNHIYATRSVIIEDFVLTADKVYISDNIHGYYDVNVPISKQPIIQKKEVVIGRGTWIGENVCILGSKIGVHCIIGANSVVTNDIPDYCVAVGAPAHVIKRYNFKNKIWEKID